jgi:hypothetical protein
MESEILTKIHGPDGFWCEVFSCPAFGMVGKLTACMNRFRLALIVSAAPWQASTPNLGKRRSLLVTAADMGCLYTS